MMEQFMACTFAINGEKSSGEVLVAKEPLYL
jgi:hypothetical protein